ncbi:YihY/virulence factor BrkB family protein [Streptomyces sp. NPDC058045]|uniref:YihY/virulence factor BrkB family protein n=1 Tax=Streptomyces sp. NPDC058045 TaxID=3346311 RepID=UPI0036EE1424
MHQANETPDRPTGRLRRVRALYRNMSKRRTAWLLLKDTVNSCMEYRILGLAAEAAFFTLLSVPPLLLSLLGLLGYVDAWTGTDTIASLRTNILQASRTFLSDQGVRQIAAPILDAVTKGGPPDIISLGFLISLWSGSRAVNVFIDTITVMYGLDGTRGIVRTRLLAFGLFLVGLLIGSVALPLLIAGPDLVVEIVPWSTTVVQVLYWPVVTLLSIVFLTTLYHVSVPVRSPWIEDVPGALVALAMWVVCSLLLRLYLTSTVEGPSIYGSLAAPVAVLLWIGVAAFAVLVGAAVNAAVDRVWPSVATAAARAAQDRARQAQAAEYEAALHGTDEDTDDDWDEDAFGEDGDWAASAGTGTDMPSEFPERWSKFLPPEDVTSRLRTHRPTPPDTEPPTPETGGDEDRDVKGDGGEDGGGRPPGSGSGSGESSVPASPSRDAGEGSPGSAPRRGGGSHLAPPPPPPAGPTPYHGRPPHHEHHHPDHRR